MSSLIRSRNGFHLSSPPLMIDGIFIIIDFRPLRMWFCVYTPVLSRMFIYEDDVMMTFAPPSFGVCNAEPSLANFFFFLLFCCWISFLPRISPTKNWSRYLFSFTEKIRYLQLAVSLARHRIIIIIKCEVWLSFVLFGYFFSYHLLVWNWGVADLRSCLNCASSSNHFDVPFSFHGGHVDGAGHSAPPAHSRRFSLVIHMYYVLRTYYLLARPYYLIYYALE